MPQMDTLTFFNQLFWVVLLFLAFYCLCVFLVLPTIARILKTRTKQLAQSQSISGFFTEKKQLASQVDATYFESSLNLNSRITKFKDYILDYQNTHLSKHRKHTFKKSNENYVTALLELGYADFRTGDRDQVYR